MSSGVQAPNLPAKLPSVALALGGGGARGLAHILMLEVFDELGIRPKLIAGTSIGAMFGAAYASGYRAADIRGITKDALRQRFDLLRQLFMARSDPVQKILGLGLRRSALLKPEVLLDLIIPPGVAKTFDGLEIPLRVVASDFFAQEVNTQKSPAFPVVDSRCFIGKHVQ